MENGDVRDAVRRIVEKDYARELYDIGFGLPPEETLVKSSEKCIIGCIAKNRE